MEKRILTEKEIIERDELVNELVSKSWFSKGQIKKNQDPAKVAQLIELGWTPLEPAVQSPPPTETNELDLPARQATPVEAKIMGLKVEHAELYARAKNKAGMSDEMMAAYPHAESLKAACDAIHPQSNPDAFPKRGSAPLPVKYEDNMPDKFEIDSMMEAKFISQNRVQFDENNLKAELRRINRKYGAHKPVKIVKTTTFNQVNGKNADRVACKVLVTHYEIFFKEPKFTSIYDKINERRERIKKG